MAERVFVTGASGQIGLPLVRALRARGYEVTGLARDPARAEAVMAAGARLVRGGLEDPEALREGLDGASIVMHLAGGVRGPGRQTADVINREGTERLLAEAVGRPLRAFVLASTCAVYGDRSGLWVTEDYPPSPQTAYGESKVAAEEAVLAAFRSRGLPARIARIAATYGPGFRFMLADAMKAGRAWLPGEGANHVPVVHVDDVVEALVRIAEAAPDGSTWHVAGRSTPTLKEFYAAIHAKVGGKPVRFWSTWIPSVFQFGAARTNERWSTRLGRKPRLTEDNLRLYTASVRMKVDRLEKELDFTWRYPSHVEGIEASFGGVPR